MSDTELLRRLRQSDAEAVREMIHLYYPSVLRFLTSLCPNSSDAEELTQEAFVKAVKGIGRFRGESGLRTWLHRIAYHEFTHRRRKLHPTAPLSDGHRAPLFEASSLLAVDLERALTDMPEEYRTAFLLCDVEELTMQEAAEVLAIPIGTVKSRLHGARTRLRLLLDPELEVKTYA